MTVKQISIFVENRPGSLLELTSFLADNNVDMRALSLADTKDFGILRLIVSNVEETFDLLKKEGFIVTVTDVLAVTIEDKPGGLVKVLKVLGDADVNIEYSYAFTSRIENHAYTIFRVADNAKAAKALLDAGVELCSQEQLHG